MIQTHFNGGWRRRDTHRSSSHPAAPTDAVADGGPVQLLPARPPVAVRAGPVSTDAEQRGQMKNGRFISAIFLSGVCGGGSHKMTRRLGGDRKTKQQQEMVDADTCLSGRVSILSLPKQETFLCRRPSTVLTPGAKLSTNLKREMNVLALVSLNHNKEGSLDGEDDELRGSSQPGTGTHEELRVSLSQRRQRVPNSHFCFHSKRARKDK